MIHCHLCNIAATSSHLIKWYIAISATFLQHHSIWSNDTLPSLQHSCNIIPSDQMIHCHLCNIAVIWSHLIKWYIAISATFLQYHSIWSNDTLPSLQHCCNIIPPDQMIHCHLCNIAEISSHLIKWYIAISATLLQYHPTWSNDTLPSLQHCCNIIPPDQKIHCHLCNISAISSHLIKWYITISATLLQHHPTRSNDTLPSLQHCCNIIPPDQMIHCHLCNIAAI